MEFFLQQFLIGLADGGTYALVALGFGLIFGVSHILNIAHAQTIMLAPALIVMFAMHGMGGGLAVPVAVLATVAIAVAVHFVGVQPFTSTRRRADHLAPLIATFGISMVIEYTVAKRIGTVGQPFPIDVPRKPWELPGGVLVEPIGVIGIVVAALALLALVLVVGRTDFGRRMRAVAENPAVASSLGVSPTVTRVVTSAIAGLLGAGAGLIFAASTNTVHPFMGLTYGLTGLVALIVGGVSRLSGAVVAALLIGQLQAMTNGYLSGDYSVMFTFGLLIVVLLVRPQGIFAMRAQGARP